jgi:hypothetical protein
MRLYLVLMVVLAGDANMRLYIVLMVVLMGDATFCVSTIVLDSLYSMPSSAKL